MVCGAEVLACAASTVGAGTGVLVPAFAVQATVPAKTPRKVRARGTENADIAVSPRQKYGPSCSGRLDFRRDQKFQLQFVLAFRLLFANNVAHGDHPQAARGLRLYLTFRGRAWLLSLV